MRLTNIATLAVITATCAYIAWLLTREQTDEEQVEVVLIEPGNPFDTW